MSRKLVLCLVSICFLLLFSWSIPSNAEEQDDLNMLSNAEEQDDLNMLSDVEEQEKEAVFSQSISYQDVGTQYWAYKNITHLSSLNVISGYTMENGDKYFNPSKEVTRAQAAKMIVEALNLAELKPTTPTFSDVPTDHWAFGYVERVASLGIVGGYANGMFGPNDTLKRSHMAKFIVEALDFDYNGYDPNKKVFSDVSSTYWAREYILKMHYNGITNGSNFRYMPENTTSRAEFSAFLSRAIDEGYRVPVIDPVEVGPTIAKGKVIAATSLNIRSGPSSTTEVIGRLPLGTIVNVAELDGYWAKISYNGLVGYVHKSYLKLSSIHANYPLKDRIIVVDAGHGAHDPGATKDTTFEKDIVLSVAKKVVAKLKNAGAQVYTTRNTDTFLSLEERVQYAKNLYAEAFVSIHVNSAGSTQANGTEVYYDTSENMNGSESKKLAYEILQEIVENADMYNRGVKDTDFYVIRNNDVASVLIELGFLTNAADREKLTSETYLNIYADAIYKGIVHYYQQ